MSNEERSLQFAFMPNCITSTSYVSKVSDWHFYFQRALWPWNLWDPLLSKRCNLQSSEMRTADVLWIPPPSSSCGMFWRHLDLWVNVQDVLSILQELAGHCHQRGDGRWTIITARFRMCQVVWCKSVVCSDVWCGLPSCHATMDRIPWIDSSLNAGHGFSDSFKFPRRFWKSLVCLWFAWCAQNG